MSTKQLTLACPYFAKDHNRYLCCRKYELNRIRDVKQHLWRQHRRRLYCPVCYNTYDYDKEEERDEHIRAKQCTARAPAEIEGVTDKQQQMLRKRVNSNQTLEEQWYSIWEIVFPTIARPNSVYLDTMLSDEMFRLRQYMVTDGVAVLMDCLATKNVVLGASLLNEADLATFQRDVAREVLEKVFDISVTKIQMDSSLPSVAFNHEHMSPTMSGMPKAIRASSTRDRVQTHRMPSLNTTGLLKSSDTKATAERLDSRSQPESQFNQWVDILEFESISQSQHRDEDMNGPTSEFSFTEPWSQRSLGPS
ncbi:hypothetical protein F4777DRAFT_401149 [Nemania sp. FL0916]|nr:hypothetical protein F4777DRAFT_401149 [Nemania sp. FL0916]